MIELKRKRFWKDTSVEKIADGYRVRLDDRLLKTPAKATLTVPSKALADAIADEWAAVEKEINPLAMPHTRAANAAIDKVTPHFDEVAGMLTEYGGSDLICYRADYPSALVQRQSDAWDPLVDWASEAIGAPLICVEGVVHQPQPPKSMEKLRGEVFDFDPFRLTGLHDLVTISGSLVIGLAVAKERLTAEEAWPVIHIDEDWQEEQWGFDAEAAETAAKKREDFLFAERFLKLIPKILP